jgi:hypothetical protein
MTVPMFVFSYFRAFVIGFVSSQFSLLHRKRRGVEVDLRERRLEVPGPWKFNPTDRENTKLRIHEEIKNRETLRKAFSLTRRGQRGQSLFGIGPWASSTISRRA